MRQIDEKAIVSIDALPKQLQQSYEESQLISVPDEYKKVKNIVVCGMGGSRFPALIIMQLFKTKLRIPIVVNDDYHLPGFVNEETLVILSSYSGTTEEIITVGKEAKGKKAKLTGLCAGGDIASFLKSENAPMYVFDPIHNPSGQPRIGFGYTVGGILGLLVAFGFLSEVKNDITQAIENLPSLLKPFGFDQPKEQNPAKQLADQLHETYPYYVVSEHLTGVGNSIANQTNETAKAISSFRVIPELNHHLMEGLKHPTELKKLARFVFFYSKNYSTPIQKRFQITKDVVEQNNIKTVWYELKGTTNVEQVFELMGLGSYLSMYLSTLYDEDPTVIPYVDYFKEQLKKS